MQDTQHTDIKCFLVVLCYIYTILKNVKKKCYTTERPLYEPIFWGKLLIEVKLCIGDSYQEAKFLHNISPLPLTLPWSYLPSTICAVFSLEISWKLCMLLSWWNMLTNRPLCYIFTVCSEYREQIQILSVRYYVTFQCNKFENPAFCIINI